MRRICIVVTSRAAYGRLKPVIFEAESRKDVSLIVVLAASAALPEYQHIELDLIDNNIEILLITDVLTQKHTHANMAATTGYLTAELARVFSSMMPDVVLAHADRYETLAVAIAASYQNIIVAHTQGGEVTGTIDESVRHAVTKLSHIHFPATAEAARNIAKMGEDKANIHNMGCPSLDGVKAAMGEKMVNLPIDTMGSGADIDLGKPFLLVLQHPVTTEYGEGVENIQKTADAITLLNIQTIWLWPNIDAGTDEISKFLRVYRDNYAHHLVRFFSNFSPLQYYIFMNMCACLLGNSSSGIREGSYIGTPVVNIGTRQDNRETAGNVLHVPYSIQKIMEAVKFQIKHGKYPQSNLYGTGNSAKGIVDVLTGKLPSPQKRLNYV